MRHGVGHGGQHGVGAEICDLLLVEHFPKADNGVCDGTIIHRIAYTQLKPADERLVYLGPERNRAVDGSQHLLCAFAHAIDEFFIHLVRSSQRHIQYVVLGQIDHIAGGQADIVQNTVHHLRLMAAQDRTIRFLRHALCGKLLRSAHDFIPHIEQHDPPHVLTAVVILGLQPILVFPNCSADWSRQLSFGRTLRLHNGEGFLFRRFRRHPINRFSQIEPAVDPLSTLTKHGSDLLAAEQEDQTHE